MNKKNIAYLVVITILLVIVLTLFDKCSRAIFKDDNIKNESISTIKSKEIFEYNLDEKPINYKVDTKKGREEYFGYLKQYIKPQKLLNFIDANDVNSIEYNSDGKAMIAWLLHRAYGNMFKSLFTIKSNSFDNCPVTEKFLKKFDMNLSDYFNLSYDEIWVDTSTLNQIIEVEARSGITLDGDAEHAMLYRFKYMLDEDGNVDDVILEHIGWD